MNIVERLEMKLAQAKEKLAKKDVLKEAQLLQKQELKQKQAFIKEAIKQRDFVNAERLIAELKNLVDLDRVVLQEKLEIVRKKD